MIQLDNIGLSYIGEPLFEGVTFSVQKGERIGLVGRNGTGKTTLFRLITGQEVPDSGTLSIAKNYRIGTLHQHIRFEQKTVLQEASSCLKEEEGLYKVEAILSGLGFSEEAFSKNPQELSGGYQLRLHLAKVLAQEPDCLLLDEPTNYLDIVSIRWFERFLKQYKGEYILISHDRAFLDSVTSHIIGLHRKKMRKVAGSTEDYFAEILREEEVHEKTRLNLLKKKEHLESFITRFGAKASKASQAQSKRKMADKLPSLEKLAQLYNLQFSFQEAPFFSETMVEMEGLSFSYREPLLRDVTLSIEKGDRIAFVGKNGRGKSTLLRLISQELQAKTGTFRQREHVTIGYFGQTNIDRLDPKKSVFQEIASARPSLTTPEVHAICGLMMFSGDKAAKTTSILSGGEKSRVLLGKILSSPCNLLLLDEPTHHLDMESIDALIDALDSFEGAIVLVTHSEHILERFSPNKMIVFDQDKQSFFLGNYTDFLEKRGWTEEKATKETKKSSFHQEKQERALFVKKRADLLRPIEKGILKVEEELVRLEEEQQKENSALIDASQQNQVSLIQSLSKSLALRGKVIDGLYEELEKLLLQKDSIIKTELM